ncbi:DUF6228 family protein [Nonomuraea spiralis]|uniref:DUF6228 family protein n=1 Tax=Nonomuraea spiralis TaxID=46182 RepID=UPI0037AA4E54
MTHGDHRPAGPPDVTVRCSQDPELVVRLSGRRSADQYETVFGVEALAGGLRAEIPDVTVTTWDAAGDLAAFLQTLADDFRGWTGERTWHTDQLTLGAIFRSGGRVELTWTLRPWSSHPPGWETSVTTWIEGGQQMTRLAAGIRAFLARP